jgi:hypothetical protein
LAIEELQQRNFNLDMTIEFLQTNNYYKILNIKNQKYIITHAPLLFEENL